VRARGVPGMERGEREAKMQLARIDGMVNCRFGPERDRKARAIEEMIKAAEEEARAPASP